MIEKTIIRYCAPTLAGLKTGSIVNVPLYGNAARQSIKALNKTLVRKGIRVIPLQYKYDKTMIYVYRPSRLSQDLQNELSRKILAEKGYSPASPEGCLVQLINKLRIYDEFPHEIGLFLGYPAEDVRGFIDNKAACCMLSGCWKVYSNVDAAKICFEQYKKCTRVYCDCLKNGVSIEKLAVAC